MCRSDWLRYQLSRGWQGVAPELHLRECILHSPIAKANEAQPTLALKSRGNVTKKPKLGYKWPKRDMCMCLTKYFKKRRIPYSLHVFYSCEQSFWVQVKWDLAGSRSHARLSRLISRYLTITSTPLIHNGNLQLFEVNLRLSGWRAVIWGIFSWFEGRERGQGDNKEGVIGYNFCSQIH